MTDRRLWSLEIDGQEYINESDMYQYRIVFDVDVRPGDTISFADIRLYNLSKKSTVEVRKSIVLRAGYTNQIDTIFTGYITNTFRERDGASTVQRFLCKSGDPVNDRSSLNSSFGPGVLLIDVLKDIAKQWPRPLDIDESQFEAIVMTSGYMLDGDATQELNRLAQAYNFVWVQERGRLIVTNPTKPRKTPVTEISQFTGMVGIPEVSRGPNGIGVYVIHRLNPYFRINGRININSEFQTFNAGNLFVVELAGDARANGEYNIFEMRYRGDSHGNLWVVEIDAIRANSAPLPTSVNDDGGAMVWGARVSQDFRVKVREICSRLNISPSWLMTAMGFETGYTFKASQPNGSGAVGLIQFTKTGITSLKKKTTIAQLARMSEVQQLDYVEDYLSTKGKLNNIGDVYMAIFAPAFVGKPDSSVLYSKPSREYNANANLDKTGKGFITRGDTLIYMDYSYKQGLKFAK